MSMEQALALDIKNGNTLLGDAISKVLENLKVVFEILPDGKKVPIGHQCMWYQMVFDIKMEDFRYKASLVAGEHMAKAPATIMYASTVSTETVRSFES